MDKSTTKQTVSAQGSQSEDIAYTINHAIACTVTDFIDPFVGKWTQDYLGKKISIGCGHDHAHDTHHHHDHHHEHDHHEHVHAKLSHWWAGELAGDFGAVPITVAFQYYAPSVMKGIEHALEPVLGGFFKNGAKRSAGNWAIKHNIAVDSEEAKNYAQQLYLYEIGHLPQALLWTASSIVINLSTQRLMGSHAPISHMLAGKAAGAGLSAALVVGARGVLPDTARSWDKFTSRNVFLPATKIVSGWFGVSEKAVDAMEINQEQMKEGLWIDRAVRRDSSTNPSL
ncbi:MAG: hypothetical protein ACK502_00220 [Alphaproteobacteria bacterium]